MESFVIYLLKAHIVLTILLAAWWLFLKKEPFFQLNRAVLLGIILLALVLPLFPNLQNLNQPHSYVGQMKSQISEVNPLRDILMSNENSQVSKGISSTYETSQKTKPISFRQVSFWQIACTVYFSVIVVLFIRLNIQLFQLGRLILEKCQKPKEWN